MLKKGLTLALLFLFMTGLYAQESYLKIGANINFNFSTGGPPQNFLNENISLPPFPGLNLSAERSIGKKFSLTLNLDYRREPSYYNIENNSQIIYSSKRVFTRILISPEIRYYFLKNQGLSDYKNQGLFLQTGMHLCSYTQWNDENVKGHYFSYLLSGKESLVFPVGLGIKYPLNTKTGIEMNVNTGLLSELILMGRIAEWQSLQLGFKFYWLSEKKKKQ